MPRRSSPQHVAQWRDRLERFSRSECSLNRFCAEEGVSMSGFYKWRKKLENGSTPPETGVPRNPAAFRPVSVMPSPMAIAIHLPGGTRIEVGVHPLEALRGIVGEVAMADLQHGAARSC